ncbi:MAG TPA: epoxyqueuosine reductase [Acholeplasmataceae bacterium]|jgi:epoxyqueuosine reductase QueG|nr:epoxyqueuosine reductase [Acholeplasmataceae bacterium]
MFNINYTFGVDYGIVPISEYLKYQEIDEKYKEKYPWMRSVIVFVFPFSNKPVKRERYLSARFAYGEDYHIVVKEKLEKIAEELNLQNYTTLTDVSFFDEKLLAYLAGLGGYGKNNLIITPKYGTNVAIGEIVTDLVLDYTKNLHESPCGDCDICLRACPTKAISTEGFTRTNCISYLTQYISDEYHLYDRIFTQAVGCDICQIVCPLNKKEYDYDPRFDFNYKSIINLNVIRNMDKHSYKEYYKTKSFHWIGYLKMLRNILTLDTNNKNITIEELKYFQIKYKSVQWFYNHIEYLKGKLNGNNKSSSV